MSGKHGGVQRLLQEREGREIPYVHCLKHQLLRNKLSKIFLRSVMVCTISFANLQLRHSTRVKN